MASRIPPARLLPLARSLALAAALLAGAQLAAPAAAQPAATEASEPAQVPAPEVDPDLAARLASPRATMHTFLDAMSRLFEQPEAWEQAVECLDLSQSAPEEGRQRARELYASLNRIDLIDVADLPGVDQVEERALEQFRFFPDRRSQRSVLNRLGAPVGSIVLRPDADGLWRFSADTVATLPALHAQLEPLPLLAGREILTFGDWLESKLPRRLVEGEFLRVRYWQWAAIFLVILLGLLADLAVRGALRILSRRVAGRLDSQEDPDQLRKTLRPIGLAAAAVLWLSAVRFVDLEGLAFQIIEGALQIFLVLAGTLAAWRLIDLTSGLLMAQAERTATRFDDVLIPLVTKAVKVFVAIMGLIYGASALDIPIAPLLASLTVAGVGFSFAAKDTVENLFGSVSVLLDRPFDIGDWIVIGDTEGIVEQVGFRSTRVRTFYNSQVTVPNSNLVRAVVDNFGRRQYRRWKTTLGLQYDTPPDKLVAFTEGVRELIRTHPYTRKDYYQVWCNEFSESSLDVLLYMFFDVPDWSTELRERERLFLDIVRLADRLGVSFAFPSRTLHVFAGQPTAAGLHPAPGARDEHRAAWDGIRAVHELTTAQPWRSERPGPVHFTSGPTEIPLDDAGNPIQEGEGEPAAKPRDREPGS